MSVSTHIVAEPRSLIGTPNANRLRAQGKIPANIYGMEEPTMSITFKAEEIVPLMVAGAHVLDVEVDGKVSKAMVKEVQWNVYYTKLLHVDLHRVDANARVDVDVEIEVKGTVAQGAMDHLLHHIMLNCPVYRVPEKLFVKVGTLRIGDTITVGQLELPEEVKAALPPETVIIRVHEAKDVDIEAAGAAGAEPEVIGRKKAEEGAE